MMLVVDVVAPPHLASGRASTPVAGASASSSAAAATAAGAAALALAVGLVVAAARPAALLQRPGRRGESERLVPRARQNAWWWASASAPRQKGSVVSIEFRLPTQALPIVDPACSGACGSRLAQGRGPAS